MFKTRFVWLGLLVALTGGCASAPPTTSQPTPDISGTWVGGLQGAGASAPATLRLVQKGPALTGDIQIGGRPDFSGPVAGRVDGSDVKLALTSGFGSLGLMQVKGDQITGFAAGAPLRLQRVK